MLASRTNFGIQTNNVNPDQTAPRGSGSTLFATETFKWTRDITADDIKARIFLLVDLRTLLL